MICNKNLKAKLLDGIANFTLEDDDPEILGIILICQNIDKLL
jgi:hypothetical protein